MSRAQHAPRRSRAPLALPAIGLLLVLAGCPEAGETKLEDGAPVATRAQPAQPAQSAQPAQPAQPPGAPPTAPEPPALAEADPRTVPELLQEGRLRMVAGDHTAAAELFSVVVAREPRNPDGYSHRGSARASVGDIEGALDDYGRALILLPDDDPRAERIRRFVDQVTAAEGAR